MGTLKTGGRWNEAEASHHINYLELMAIFFGLKAFCMKEYSVHIQVYSDNTTAVNYINSMGGTHSMECHSVAKTIRLFCMERKIWLSAAHIPGKNNITADRESRIFSDNKEWLLSTHLFQEIFAIWGEPTIDLFASRLNKQVACYVSWKPDPEASYVDAFSISWNDHLFYAFPPFSLIARCLQKIELEKSEGITIVPMWDTQPWYSQLLRMLTDVPRTLPQRSDTLQMPTKRGMTHPLIKKMTLMVCRVSGDPLKHKEFQNELQTSYYNLGDKENGNDMRRTSSGGLSIVIGNMSVVLIPLFPKRWTS